VLAAVGSGTMSTTRLRLFLELVGELNELRRRGEERQRRGRKDGTKRAR